MKLIDELEKLGLELTDEQKGTIEKKGWGEVISVAESDKKVQKVQAQLDNANEKLSQTEEALKAFDGVDAEGMKKKIAELEQANKDKDAKYQKDLQARDYHDAIEKLTADVKFSSNAAKKQFIADLEKEPLQMRDGKVLGFEDYLKGVQESDPDSFAKDPNGNAAKFTTPNGQQTDDNKADKVEESALRAAMGLPPKKEN